METSVIKRLFFPRIQKNIVFPQKIKKLSCCYKDKEVCNSSPGGLILLVIGYGLKYFKSIHIDDTIHNWPTNALYVHIRCKTIRKLQESINYR